MLPDRLSLKLNSVLRRAGLADVSRPALVGVCVICIVLVLVALWRFWPAASAQSEDFAVQTQSSEAGQQAEQNVQDTAAQEAELYVDVEGAVVNPGVYVLPADARIADAVSAAGGLEDDAARQGVNLAQKLEDGMQVYVPSEKEASSGAAGSDGASGAGTEKSNAKINLNTASVEELQELDGIGPSLSQRIVDYREEHGRFSSVEELKEVSGIGDVRFEALKDDVCL